MFRLLTLLTTVAAAVYASETQPANGWVIEKVDVSGPGRTTSMKVDKHGNLHICYMVGQGQLLKYAFRDQERGKWFVMTVDQNPNNCSLALDSQQRPHISYGDYGTGEGSRLRYAYWNGTSWIKQVIPVSSSIVSGYISIAIDAADRPSLAYYEYRGPRGTDFKIRLRHVGWNGKQWEMRTVDGEEGSGKVNNMTADSKGLSHLVYANVATGEMRYAFWNGTAWTLEMVESRLQSQGQYVGLSCAVTTDRNDTPHVTYLNTTAMLVKYAVRTGGRWKTENIGRVTGVMEDFDRNSIMIDDLGRPWVGYYDPGVGVLQIVHKDGGKWITETVDGNGAGFTSSMQIHGGKIWISYSDESGMSLKVAHRPLTLSESGASADQTAKNGNEQRAGQ